MTAATDQAYRLAIDTVAVLMDGMNELEARMRLVDPDFAYRWTTGQRQRMADLMAKVEKVRKEIEKEIAV